MRGIHILILMSCAAYGAFMAINAWGAGASAIHEIEALVGTLIVAVASAAGYIGECAEWGKPKKEPKVVETKVKG